MSSLIIIRFSRWMWQTFWLWLDKYSKAIIKKRDFTQPPYISRQANKHNKMKYMSRIVGEPGWSISSLHWRVPDFKSTFPGHLIVFRSVGLIIVILWIILVWFWVRDCFLFVWISIEDRYQYSCDSWMAF